MGADRRLIFLREAPQIQELDISDPSDAEEPTVKCSSKVLGRVAYEQALNVLAQGFKCSLSSIEEK